MQSKIRKLQLEFAKTPSDLDPLQYIKEATNAMRNELDLIVPKLEWIQRYDLPGKKDLSLSSLRIIYARLKINNNPEQNPALCPLCSTKIPDAALFCPYCGMKIQNKID